MTAEDQKTNVSINSQPPLPLPKKNSNAWRGLLILAVLGLGILGYFIATGLHARAEAKSNLEHNTLTMSVSTVAVIHPKVIAGAEEVVLPGNMQAFTDTPVWARASGYLKAWHADIGTHVQKGQLLAEIEAPEVDQQLQAAREQLATDEANLKLAEITADRYSGLLKQDSIAKQDVDTAVQNAKARAATVNASEANVKRLEQMVAYERVYAPFNGVITARNIDVGALINAGANAPGKELFHIASNAILRVYVSVPEAYSRAAKPGVNAYLTLNEFPGRQFHGAVVRNADAIDMSSRTLLVEVDVKNPTGELLPGSYTSVHLKLPSKIEAVTVPSNALLFRAEGLQIALVRDGRTALVPVVMGRDYGDTVEIVSGVKGGDSVIVNPSDSIVSGEKVQVTGS
ncbi:MAG: efflux RND transporter periplasmic adaptor subunit [Acidobacteriaceae bacterium]|nr:efflux RND transporter periplasmic adaptor subunit [Acidobacteriaceae bacterium]MBV9222502.1 efflux RND transporter periplasmic adaptor subunit [Acidobacteriaceae bacterium]